VLQLAANERVVSKAILVSGLLVFSTFDPFSPELCEFSGNGAVYALLATNANSIAGPNQDRSTVIEGFAGRATITPAGMAQAGPDGEQTDPFDSERMQGIRENLMAPSPPTADSGASTWT
jgi:hypothetical protein